MNRALHDYTFEMWKLRQNRNPQREVAASSQRACLSEEARTGALLREGLLRDEEGVRGSRARAESYPGAWLLGLEATTASLHGPVSGSSEPLH